MASNKNDIHVKFSKLTESEIDKFCLDYGIDPSLETRVPGDKTANQSPEGFLVFYTRILDQPNLFYKLFSCSFKIISSFFGSTGPCWGCTCISQDWVDSGFEPFFVVGQKGMYFCEIPEGNPSVVRRTEHVRTAGDFESVRVQPIMDGSSAKKPPLPVRRSTKGASSLDQEVPEASSGACEVPGQKIVDVLKKLNESKRSVPEKVVPSKSSKIVLKKKVKGSSSKPTSPKGGVSANFQGESTSSLVEKEKVVEKCQVAEKEKVVKEKVKNVKYGDIDKGKGSVMAISPIFNLATPAEKEALSKLSDEDSAYRSDELTASLEKKDAELKTSQDDLAAFQVKVIELEGQLLSSQVKMNEEMKKVEVYVGQLSDFNNQLAKERAEFRIERAKYKQERVAEEAVTEELRQQFNLHLAGKYSKEMAHGRHTDLFAGFDATSHGEVVEKLPAFKPDSLPDFVHAVKKMEGFSYPYVEALSEMVDCPIAELEALEPKGLNKELCAHLLSVSSVKRALFETNDEEGEDAGPSSKKLKVILEPEPVSSMSIPIDAPPLSFARGESAPLVPGDDEGLDYLDGLYDDLPQNKNPFFGDVGGSSSA
ncbi:hypothetical protein Hanom_Chr10g00907181 [Helianthus anomalus]